MDKKPFDHSFTLKDNPSIYETFVDGIHMTQVDGTTARVTFTISRMDPPKTGNKTPTGSKVVAARLAMPLPTLAEFYNQLDGLIRGLESQGLMTRNGPTAQTVQ